MAHSSPSCAASEAKFRLAGKVAGIDACQLVSDCDEVIVGSALACDLVVTDPLVPAQAFRLRRQRDHFESETDCKTYWLLECYPGARVFVNNDLVRRGHVKLGDVISLGCHQLQFTVADPEARNWESNTKIDDVCERLIRRGELPPGYLEGCPSWANRRRTRIAVFWTSVLVFLIAVASLFTPRQEVFMQVQAPMEVVTLSEPPPDAEPGNMLPTGQRKTSPQPPAVRSLEHVERKTVGAPEEQSAPGNLMASAAPAVDTLDTKAVETAPMEQAAKPAAPQFGRPTVDESSMLPTVQMAHDDEPQPEITHSLNKLDPAIQVRRLSVAEAADPVMQTELGRAGIQIDSNTFSRAAVATAAATPMNQWSGGSVTRSVAKPGAVQLASNRGEQLAALAAYKPSPVRWEQQGDVIIPVARLPGALNPIGIDDPNAADKGKTTGNVVLNGEVTDSEIAVSWKSGQFHTHGPGTPPPLANPETYCYVGKTDKDGKHCLYILFTCMDPNPDQLITQYSSGQPELSRDDSVEIFLSTDMNLHHYRQLIVNARGNWWSSEVQNQGNGKYTIGPAWDAQPELKTTINKTGGRWTCKLLIPFDRLGGEPAKGTSWGVNFCRNFRGQSSDDSHLQTWFSVYDKSRNFHNSERFGKFEW